VSRAHWDYFCWTVRFDTSPGEHGQSTGLAECEMVHVTSGSERRDWPVIRALWLLLLSYKVRKMAKKCRPFKILFASRRESLTPKRAPESGYSIGGFGDPCVPGFPISKRMSYMLGQPAAAVLPQADW